MAAMKLKSRATPGDALESIPGVGRSVAGDLRDLGYTCVADLCGENPARMYYTLCDLRGAHIDRCMLYVFRCAVYYASNETYDSDLLKWWNWKDDAMRRPTAPRRAQACALPTDGSPPSFDCCE